MTYSSDNVQAHFQSKVNLRDCDRLVGLIRFVVGQGPAYEPLMWSAERATGGHDIPFCGQLEGLASDIQDPGTSGVEFVRKPLGPYLFLVQWGSRLGVSPNFVNTARVLLQLPYQDFQGPEAPKDVDHWLSVLLGIYDRIGAFYGYSHETHDYIALTRIEEKVGRSILVRDRTKSAVPALFWANIFGPDLVALIGRERLEQAPCWRRQLLLDGGILLVFSPNPLDFMASRELRQRLYQEWDLEHLTKPVYRQAPNPPTSVAQPELGLETPERCRELADICVDTARQVSKIELDYSPTSLRLLDEVIDQGWQVGAQPGEVIATMGCYLGETVIRHLGGAWSWEGVVEGMAQPHVLWGRRHLNVIGKVRKRFQAGASESLSAYFAMVQAQHEDLTR